MTGTLLPHLEGVAPAPDFSDLGQQAQAAEAWTTARWAAEAILDVELLTPNVIDAGCGTGVLTLAARKKGYANIWSVDKYDWGFAAAQQIDWLTVTAAEIIQAFGEDDFTVFFNPPFSLACQFVDRARSLDARKIVCFQRQAWRESQDRREWWDANPPARVWTCGDRAHTWLFSIPPEDRRGGRFMPCAWYVWERGHKGAELGGAVWKKGEAA